MKVLLNQKKKNPGIEVIENLYSSFASMSSNRMAYANDLVSFGSDVYQMCKVVCPEYLEQIQEINDTLGKISACNIKLAKAEFRVSDDIRDIAERFAVIERVNGEFRAQEDKYQASNNNLLEALAEKMSAKKDPGYQKVKTKIDANIIKAKVEKNSDNKILKSRIQSLIDAKEKYNKFKTRRLTSAWKTMAEALEVFSQTEISLYQNLKESLEKLKADENAPSEVVNSLSEISQPVPTTSEEEAAKKIKDLGDESTEQDDGLDAPPQDQI